MNEELFQDLAQAIIVQAVKDYRYVKIYLKKKPRNEVALKEKSRIEKFFRSNWFNVLTNLDAEMLIKKLEKEC